MHEFNEKDNSLSELYSSIFRGNEIEFQYNEKYYYILPNFVGNKVVSICFGEANTENEVECLSENDLYNAQIEDTFLGSVISQINIVWRNF